MGPSSATILQSKSLHPSLSWEVVSTPLSRLPPSTLSSPHPSLSGKLIACCPAHLSRAGGDEEEKMKVYVLSLYIHPGGLRKPGWFLKSPFQHCEDLQWDIHSSLKREKRLRENIDKHLYNSSHKPHQTDALDQNNTVKLIKLNPISTQTQQQSTSTKYNAVWP